APPRRRWRRRGRNGATARGSTARFPLLLLLLLRLELLERGGELVLLRPRRGGGGGLRRRLDALRSLGADGGGLFRGQQAHLPFQRGEIVFRAGGLLEVVELRGQDVAGVLLLDFARGLGLGLHLVNLARHALERLEGALITEAMHGLLNRLLRFRALLPGDE